MRVWTAEPAAAALLSRCHAEPPVAIGHETTFVQTRDEWVTYTGPIADALRLIRDERTAELSSIADNSGLDVDCDTLRDHLRSPSVEEAIDEAMASAVRARPGSLSDLMVAICRPMALAA